MTLAQLGSSIFKRFIILAICVLFIPQARALEVFGVNISLGGDQQKSAPPAHAPAYGARAKHQYRYYPSSQVYFDIGRGMYFHLNGGEWKATARLPGDLKVKLGKHVSLEMDTDKPYRQHHVHKQKYPSGQAKKLKLSSGKGNKAKAKAKGKFW